MALIGSLTSGVSALEAFEKGIEVIGNNIANVNTTGFKSGSTQYSDSFSNLLKQAAPSTGLASNTDTLQVGTGVQVSGIPSNFTQGTLASTGSNTDLGISGTGFFRVRDVVNNRDYVTRAGDFRLDDNGYLVTSDGFRVQGLSDGTATYNATDDSGALTYTQTSTAPAQIGDIKVDFNLGIGAGLTNGTGGAFTDAQVEAGKPAIQSFTVDQLGNVVLSLTNGDTLTRGQVMLQAFKDPNALVREGKNLFSNFSAAGPVGGAALSATNNLPGSYGLGRIEVGTLESSNVDLSAEFANLITTQRSFQAASRIITTSDDVLQEIIQLKR